MSTKIEWTVTVQPDGTVTPGETWNPIRAARPVGGPDDPIGWHCERVSPGCEHCYAETINQRRFGTGLPYNRKSRDLVRIGIDDATLAKPLQWRKPRKIFTCSMTDLFAEWVTDDMLDRIFAVMALAPQHTFQLLTKRPERMRAYMNDPATTLRVVHASDTPDGERRIPLGCWNWPLRNVWAGTSVENQAMADLRTPELLATPAAVHYLSMEPLLEGVDLTRLNLGNGDHGDCLNHRATDIWSGAGNEPRNWGRIDWVIVGGESGPKARPCDVGWIRSIVAQCQGAHVKVFVKQIGACSFDPIDGASNPAGFDWRQPIGDTYRLNVRDRRGADPSEWPASLRVREFPEVGR